MESRNKLSEVRILHYQSCGKEDYVPESMFVFPSYVTESNKCFPPPANPVLHAAQLL